MSLTAIVVLSLSFSAVLYSITPNDYNKYIREMHVFTELQERGINFYKIYQHASPGTQLFEIDSIAIPSWKEAKRIVLHADSLQVPDALHDRDKALLEYCNLRIELFGLYHSKISERSSTYDNDIKTNTEALDIILKKLNTEK